MSRAAFGSATRRSRPAAPCGGRERAGSLGADGDERGGSPRRRGRRGRRRSGDDEGDERAFGEAGERLQGGGVDGGGVAREVGGADAEEEDVLGAAPCGPRDARDGDEGPRRAREAGHHAVTEAGG